MRTLAALAALGLAGASNSVNTTYGPITTSNTGNGVTIYRSIPYAAPPTGQLRFRAPQPPNPWSSPLDTSAYPNACPQIKLDGSVRRSQQPVEPGSTLTTSALVLTDSSLAASRARPWVELVVNGCSASPVTSHKRLFTRVFLQIFIGQEDCLCE